MSSFSIYKNNKAIATPGKTIPTNGTRIEGKYEAVILLIWLKFIKKEYNKAKILRKGEIYDFVTK